MSKLLPSSARMIQRTIKEHLAKELRLAPQGIKGVEPLFIDAVEKIPKI